MELAVVDIKGNDTGKKVALNDAVFGIEPNDHAIYLDVKQFAANQRQGTHKSKERAEITGSTRKIKKQKGTGTARAGSIKSPLFKGGGRVFGPQPRDYSFKLNRKLKMLARKSALSTKASNNEIMAVEDFSFDAPSTKQMIEIIGNLGLSDKKSLLVFADSNKNVYLSSRNLKGVEVINASELNTYGILKAAKVVIVGNSAEVIENTLS